MAIRLPIVTNLFEGLMLPPLCESNRDTNVTADRFAERVAAVKGETRTRPPQL